MTDILISNNHPTLKLRLRDDGWCEDASCTPGEGPRFRNVATLHISGGTFRDGDFWGGTFWGGTFRGGDFRGGDFRGGDFWGGAFWGGTFRDGDFWGGTFRDGDFTFALTAQRSDGYVFTVNDNGLKVAAGCRYFTFDEAREHWTQTRGGTQLGEESLAILDHLERMIAICRFANQETTT